MNVAIIGGSGLVGSSFILQAVEHPQIEKIYCIARSSSQLVKHPKVIQVNVDFNNLEKEVFQNLNDKKIHAAICTLGTTLKKAGSKEKFKQVDFHHTFSFALACKNAFVLQFVLISSVGANSKSTSFYLQVKGEVEEALKKINFDKLKIFHPGLLIGFRKESRPIENLAQKISPILNCLMVGPLEKYKAVKAEDLAKSILNQLTT